MDTLFEGNYLWVLIATFCSYGWVYFNQALSEGNRDYIELYDTWLYTSIKALFIPVVLISLIIFGFQTNFINVLYVVGVLIVAHLLNRLIIYPIYNYIFGYSGIGALITPILAIGFSIALFIVQI